MAIEILRGTETLGAPSQMGQVYKVTHHNGQRLDYMYRSFISFTYGGQHIEDFNLIATFTDSGFDKTGYADFEDIVSENNVVDGQIHWGTHISTRVLEFELVTDSMTQQQLDKFLAWFTPGKARELILAEHPNRAAYARVKDPPQLKLTPFESRTTVKLGGKEYVTSTTLYRGNIDLNFVMDKPYWYSLVNIFGEAKEENGTIVYYDTWTDANDREVSVFESKDAIKIALEDGIPFSNMIANTMTFGSDIVADVSNDSGGRLFDDSPGGYGDIAYENETVDNIPDNQWQYRIAVFDENDIYLHGAVIAGITISTNTENERTLTPQDALYFYYAGTARAYPELSFTIKPHYNAEGYIDSINNSYTSPDKKYNTITIESCNKSEFKFTTPSIFTAYNQAIHIFKNIQNESVEQVRENIRETVKHYIVRDYANRVLDNNSFSSQVLCEQMQGLFNFIGVNSDPSITENAYTASFTFNSETGVAIGKFQYNALDENGNKQTSYLEENVGDMVKSSYLIIRDRNYPDEEGNIKEWTENQPNNSYKLTHDLSVNLEKISLNYKNMYW